MATSGSKTVGVAAHISLKFEWDATGGQSVIYNATTVKWKLKLISDTAGVINSTVQKDWFVVVDGKSYSGKSLVAISPSSTVTLASGSTIIDHNSDGTKTFSYSFDQYFGITYAGVWVGEIGGNGSGTLNTIPRATMPTVSSASVDMGAAVTISTPRASSSFTHDLAYSFAGGTYVAIKTGVGTSYSWTTPDLASKIPSAASGTVTIRCITKNGSTTIGTKTVTMTLKVPASVVPTISVVTTEEAATGMAQLGAFVKSMSKVKATITAAGAKGSTIKAYNSTFNGRAYDGQTWTSSPVTASGALELVTTVTDSRGRTAKKTTTVTVLDYSNPVISALQAYRVNAEGEADPDGVYIAVRYAYRVEPLEGNNTATMKVEYRRSTETEWTELLTGTELSADTTVIPASPTFSTDYQYDVRLTLTDYFYSANPYVTQLPSGAVILDIRADGLGLGLFKTADREGVDFGASPKGAVLGLWESTANIPEGGNFNEYTIPGVYGVSQDAIMQTLENRPCDRAGTLRVSSGLGSKRVSGAYAYLVQEYHSYNNDEPIYRRHLLSYEDGIFYSSPWKAITFKGQKVLWSGAAFMNENTTVSLSEQISKQDSGIELVFSGYYNGAVVDKGFIHVFVSKTSVALHGSLGICVPLFSHGFSSVATKFLYISNSQIQGHADNAGTGTANGVTYNNSRFVLRYVIGV